jgi:AraC-like DNA-binding protein
MSAPIREHWASRPSQRYAERRAAPEFDAHVACVWLLEVADGGPVYEHRTVPNGCVEIASVLGTGVVHVAGPKHSPTLERVEQGQAVVGVRFRPGAAPRVLKAAAGELVALDLDLDALWGAEARALSESLSEAATSERAMDVLEQAVAARMSTAPAPDPVVTEAVARLQPWRRAGVTEVASALFMSPRQLRRRFVAAVGYGPKTLQRILRFQGFLALSDACRGANAPPPVARLAATAGYADQAHLTRDCRELTALTPRAFLDEKRRSCGSSHDHEASFAFLRRALLAAGRS